MLRTFETESVGLRLDTCDDYDFNTHLTRDGAAKTALLYGRNASGKSLLFRRIMAMTQEVDLCRDGNKPAVSCTFTIEDDDGETRRITYECDRIGTNASSGLMYGIAAHEHIEVDGHVVWQEDIDEQSSNAFLKGKRTRTVRCSPSFVGNDDEPPCRRVSGYQQRTQLAISHLLDTARPTSLAYRVATYLDSIRMIDACAATDFSRIRDEHELKELCKLLASCGIERDLTGHGYTLWDEARQEDYHPSDGERELVNLFIAIHRLPKTPGTVPVLLVDNFASNLDPTSARTALAWLAQQDAQVIAATHDTDLIDNDLMRPDTILTMRNGQACAIHRRTLKELRRAHNLRALYLAGEFDDDDLEKVAQDMTACIMDIQDECFDKGGFASRPSGTAFDELLRDMETDIEARLDARRLLQLSFIIERALVNENYHTAATALERVVTRIQRKETA